MRPHPCSTSLNRWQTFASRYGTSRCSPCQCATTGLTKSFSCPRSKQRAKLCNLTTGLLRQIRACEKDSKDAGCRMRFGVGVRRPADCAAPAHHWALLVPPQGLQAPPQGHQRGVDGHALPARRNNGHPSARVHAPRFKRSTAHFRGPSAEAHLRRWPVFPVRPARSDPARSTNDSLCACSAPCTQNSRKSVTDHHGSYD